MNKQPALDSGSFFRRSIFAAILLGIFIIHTVFSFNGLTSRTGIDQAQVAREVARGNGLTTQFVRPLSIQQMTENGKVLNLEQMPETFHSPLNILIYAGALKMVGADDFEKHRMQENDKVYALDRVITVTCSIFFLIAIGINYLLISRIFDRKLASVVALVMALSEYMWQITAAGLPQMLMLTLFSTACYLTWRAVEAQEAERSPLLPALLSGVFFGLLALSHWMTLWIFIGYFIFAAIYFKPRAVIAGGLSLIIFLFIVGPLIFYWNQSGEALGTAFHTIHGAGNPSDTAMRQLSTTGFDVRGLLIRTAQTTLVQASNIHNYLGGLVLAPAFFIALAHPFKRSSIANFRWAILLMWILASVGMAIYGLENDFSDPNQLHILFAPLMCAYGLAMLSIIWSRCPLSQQPGLIGNLHFAIILLVSSGPLMIHLKSLSQNKPNSLSVDGVHAYALNGLLNKITDERDIIVSDQPWAVAWYADRHAIWQPQTLDDLVAIETLAEKTNPIAGLHTSSEAYRNQDIRTTLYNNRDLTPLAYTSWISYLTQDTNAGNLSNNKQVAPLVDPNSGRYPYRASLHGLFEPSTYFSRTPITLQQ
ncbi:ArnT family glycosyltransferase [Rubritalea tangerina]|uniref:ArnT family glycosyltransferase n=1 Tax=Rubritalea tangerina TaxID=430798 RepID=A0ABW4Z7L6_9BACT